MAGAVSKSEGAKVSEKEKDFIEKMDLLDQDGLSHRFQLLMPLTREQSAFVERHDAARLEASRRGVGMCAPLDALATCLEIQQAADVVAARGEPG